MNHIIIDKIDSLIKIANELNLTETSEDLSFLKERMEQPNKSLVVPLVGEFSSGKTSLINALTDSKQLETASKATTATIFEVRFGCERCYAEIIDTVSDSMQVEENIGNLKNETLGDVELVRIYDTSDKVSPTTVLVDTPGLSSNDPKHKLTLSKYLPQADAILLVTDVNQQITRSLMDFIDNTKLVERPMFLVITKCDTKTTSEISAVKEYIKQNINLPVENIVCVSAVKGELNELYTLFDNIQVKKNQIVVQAINKRVSEISNNLLDYIDELLRCSSSDSEIENKIRDLQNELTRLSNNIEKLIRDASSSISEKGDECVKRFQDNAFARLDSIVRTQGQECDEAVYTSVNMIANTAIQQYKNDIQYVLTNMARERQRTVEAVPLQSLEALDLSSVAMNELSYNMNLSSLGHEYDKIIGGTVKVAAAVGVVVGAAYLAAPAAAAATGTAAKAGGQVAGKAIDVIDTVSDTASIVSNISTRKKIQESVEKASSYASKIQKEAGNVETWNIKNGQKYTSSGKGVIETSVSWVTDNLWGKPQRRRAVNNYISGTLIPEFSMQIDNIRTNLVRTIGQLLHEEAQNRVSAMEQTLNTLKAESTSQKEQYKQRMKQLKEYKDTLKNG